MKNTTTIGSLCWHLSRVAEHITDIAGDMERIADESDSSADSVYADILLDSLEQVQKLTLALTERITAEIDSEEKPANTDGDGSVFAPGELQSVKKPAIENPVEPETEEEK